MMKNTQSGDDESKATESEVSSIPQKTSVVEDFLSALFSSNPTPSDSTTNTAISNDVSGSVVGSTTKDSASAATSSLASAATTPPTTATITATAAADAAASADSVGSASTAASNNETTTATHDSTKINQEDSPNGSKRDRVSDEIDEYTQLSKRHHANRARGQKAGQKRGSFGKRGGRPSAPSKRMSAADAPQILSARDANGSHDLEACLFIQQLPPYVKEHELLAFFSKYGAVEVFFKHNSGFVQFQNPESCRAAVQQENGALFRDTVLGLAQCTREGIPRNVQVSHQAPSEIQRPQPHNRRPVSTRGNFHGRGGGHSDRGGHHGPSYGNGAPPPTVRRDQGYYNGMSGYGNESYVEYGPGRRQHNGDWNAPGFHAESRNDRFLPPRHSNEYTGNGRQNNFHSPGPQGPNSANGMGRPMEYQSNDRFGQEPMNGFHGPHGRGGYANNRGGRTKPTGPLREQSRKGNQGPVYSPRQSKEHISHPQAATKSLTNHKSNTNGALIHVLVQGDLHTNFLAHVEKTLRAQNFRVMTRFISPDSDRQHLIQQKGREGIDGLVILDPVHEQANKVFFVNYYKTSDDNLKFDEYTSVTLEDITMIRMRNSSSTSVPSMMLTQSYPQKMSLSPPSQGQARYGNAAPQPSAPQPPASLDVNTLATIFDLVQTLVRPQAQTAHPTASVAAPLPPARQMPPTSLNGNSDSVQNLLNMLNLSQAQLTSPPQPLQPQASAQQASSLDPQALQQLLSNPALAQALAGVSSTQTTESGVPAVSQSYQPTHSAYPPQHQARAAQYSPSQQQKPASQFTPSQISDILGQLKTLQSQTGGTSY